MKANIKNYFILFLIVGIGFYSKKGIAQTPTWAWAKSAGITGSEATMGTALDASGNLFAIGWYTSANITFGSTTLVNPGSYTGDIFLVKYDAAGNVLWAKTFGGADGDIGNAIAIDLGGNVYITGWYASTSFSMGTYTLTNSAVGSSDIFIAKLDPAGNVIWARSAGGTSADRGYGISVDASGNVFTTGGFGSNVINFGTGPIVNSGSGTQDFFIVKQDAAGNALWAKSAGGTNADIGYSLANDSLGNVFVTGSFSSASVNFGAGTLNNSSAGTQDLFTVKYDGLGTAAWSSRAGGSMDDFGNSIMVRGNNVYVTGAFNSASIAFGTTTLTNASAGTGDVLLAKYDLSGNSIWAKREGGSDSEAGNAVAADSAGKVYISGYFSSTSITFGSTTLNNAAVGYRDLFVSAFDGNGNSTWATSSSGGVYDETANAVSVNPTGGSVYTGGTFNSGTVLFGSTTVYKGCGDDVFVAKLLGPLVGIKEENTSAQLTLYPNPTSGKFIIEAEGQIILYNLFGKIIGTEKINHGTELDLSSQSKGIYLYKVLTTKQESYSGRIIIQ